MTIPQELLDELSAAKVDMRDKRTVKDDLDAKLQRARDEYRKAVERFEDARDAVSAAA